MSMTFSLTGADLAATLRRMSEDALKRTAAKRVAEQQQTQERMNDQPGE